MAGGLSRARKRRPRNLEMLQRLDIKYAHRDSPGNSTRRGQRTFQPDNKED